MRIRGPLCLALALSLLRCGAPAEDERSRLQVPPFDTFPPVSQALHSHCGSLDCHGDVARNMRLYGLNGLRLAPNEIPGMGVITDAEHQANYRSVVALEPELLSAVFAEGSRNAERLTLIRKGRGDEHHKGGVAMVPGGAADRCVLTWLASRLDDQACTEAAEILRPGADAAPP